MGKQWEQCQLYFLGLQNPADGGCRHELKDACSLEEDMMTDLDNILKKQKHIFANKGLYIVKAMVFPVVMYGCESWTIKKAEH